jgi:hypothetical protein
MEKIISGLAWHVHHRHSLEWCYDYDERVKAIKESKPMNEQETRLRLLKILSKEALSELPSAFQKAAVGWQKAYADWQKAYADWQKAYADWQKARADWQKARADWQKARADWQKAYADWQKAYADNETAIGVLHAKYCGCKEWNGEELVFPGAE